MIIIFLKFNLIVKSFVNAIKDKWNKVFKIVKGLVFLGKERPYLMQCSPVIGSLAKKQKMENVPSESEKDGITQSSPVKSNESLYGYASERDKWEIIDFLKKNNPELIKKLESDAKSKGFYLDLDKVNTPKNFESGGGSISPLSLDDSTSKDSKPEYGFGSGSATPNALEINKHNEDAYLRMSKQGEPTVNTDVIENKLKSETQFDSVEFLDMFFKDNSTPRVAGLEEFNNNIMFYSCVILFGALLLVITFLFKLNSEKPFKNRLKFMCFRDFVRLICFLIATILVCLGTDFDSLTLYSIELYLYKFNIPIGLLLNFVICFPFSTNIIDH
jgi:Cytochrome C oxidase subunit II, transmembrane domain